MNLQIRPSTSRGRDWSLILRSQTDTPKKMKNAITSLILLAATASFADDLSQLYEKAYFLETAKGQTEEAVKIYRQIASVEPTVEEKEVAIRALKRLTEIYAVSTMPEGSHQEQLAKAIQLQQLNKHTEALALLEKLMLSGAKEQPMTKREEFSFTYDLMEALFASAHILKDESKMASYHKQLLKNPMVDVRMVASKMPDGGVIYLPEGTYTWGKIGMSVDDQRSITIRGADREKCIIERTSDRSMIWVGQGGKLTLENLTLKSKLSSLDKEKTFEELGCALLVEDGGTATLTNCTIQASGPTMRCPSAVKALGFAEVNLFNCSLSGYAIPVYLGEGSNGTLSDCRIEHTLRMNKDTIVKVSRTIFHDARYEAISCYGGKLKLQSCLLINAEATAIGVGSATEEFVMSNSLVFNCGTILQHQPSRDNQKGTISLENNVFAMNIAEEPNPLIQESRSYHPDECHIKNNILLQNKLVGWNHTLRMECRKSNTNIFWENQLQKKFEIPQKDAQFINPEFKDAANGDFTIGNTAVQSAGHGLTDPATIQALWKKYKESSK